MQAMTRDFFQNLYTSEGTANMSAVLDHVPSKVTDSMNTFQCAPFTEKEVKATWRQDGGEKDFAYLTEVLDWRRAPHHTI